MKDSTVIKQKGERFVELEAFRGIAALLIVLFHAYQQSRVTTNYVYQSTFFHFILRNLDMGVACFFVLSGFLIFLPFARATITQQGPRSARGFLIRRVIRIVPLYYVAILFVWATRYVGLPEQRLELLEHLTFTQVFDKVHIFWTIGPAWTLADEVWFYAFLAIFSSVIYKLCVIVQKKFTRVFLLTSITALLGIVSIFYKWWAYYSMHIPLNNYPMYYGPLATFDTFAIGMLLAIAYASYESGFSFKKWIISCIRIVGVIFLLFIFALRASNSFVSVYFNTLCAAAFLLFLASTVGETSSSFWKRALSHQPLRFLGLISYSLYLWHEPLLIWLSTYSFMQFTSPLLFPISTVVLIAISIFVATVSYWGVEYPTKLLRNLFTQEGQLIKLEKISG